MANGPLTDTSHNSDPPKIRSLRKRRYGSSIRNEMPRVVTAYPARLDDGICIAGMAQAPVQFRTPVSMDVVVGADGLIECVGESALGDDG